MTHVTDVAPGDFVAIDVEPGPAHADGISLRFRATASSRVLSRVWYESLDGVEGWWSVQAIDDAAGALARDAIAVTVDDSSEGVSLLVAGGRHGLRMTHETGSHTVFEAYLLLARTTRTEP